MAKRRKSKKRTPAKPRDPFWRLRRLLGAKTEKNPKAYDRGAERDAARKAIAGDD